MARTAEGQRGSVRRRKRVVVVEDESTLVQRGGNRTRVIPTLSTLKRLGMMVRGQRGYINIDYELVEEMAGNGLTQEEIAEALGINIQTVSDRLHGNGNGGGREPDTKFRAAYLAGKAQMRHIISNGLFEKARKGEVVPLIFLAKTRMAWRENDNVNLHLNVAEVAQSIREELEKVSQ